MDFSLLMGCAKPLRPLVTVDCVGSVRGEESGTQIQGGLGRQSLPFPHICTARQHFTGAKSERDVTLAPPCSGLRGEAGTVLSGRGRTPAEPSPQETPVGLV